MEVHHHSPSEGLPAAKTGKKLKHYLFEFFMLFLAVFCGFLAENQRENFVEGKREKEYILSMIDDLKTDTASFGQDLISRKSNRKMVDSLISLLSQSKRTTEEQQYMYYLARNCIARVELPQFHDKTYEQMKSSGNLRLIRKKNISDSISEYYFNAKEIQVNINLTQSRILSTIEAEGKVFKGIVFQQIVDKDNFHFSKPVGYPELITNDNKVINELIVRFHYLISISAYTEIFFNVMKNRAIRLIAFLQNEYHLN